MRPYFEQAGKQGFIPTVNTRIKRKNILDAVTKMIQLRNTIFDFSNGPVHHGLSNADGMGDHISQLPGEVRNMIYSYALDIGTPAKPTTRVLGHGKTSQKPTGSLGLLQTSKQISAEARTLMEAIDVAYLPVMSHIKYELMAQNMLASGPSSLDAADVTCFTALTSYMNVHLHLHTRVKPGSTQDDGEPRIDPMCVYFYGRLRQVITIYTTASIPLASRWPGRKRRAILHLDHFFSDWRLMVRMRGPYSFQHIVRLMGEDTQTEWELRYYVYTADEVREVMYWPTWDEDLREEMDKIMRLCAHYTNIKVVAEVYGKLKWGAEGDTEHVTRVLTPSTALWPSWPDFQMVKSST
jgi:hypothetical protein